MSSSRSKALTLLALVLQILHGVVLFFPSHRLLASNVLQFLVSSNTCAICLANALESRDNSRRRQWMQLSSAFFIWTVAQIIFTLPMLFNLEISPNISTVIWLLFPFPLLLVASRFAQQSDRDTTNWFDIAQATVFFSMLFLLVFLRPQTMTSSHSFELQSVALALAFIVRYSMTSDDRERRFHRDLTLFACTYALFSIIGYLGADLGVLPGSLSDICWTLPFTFYSVLAFRSRTLAQPQGGTATGAKHLHGISALGLAIMSLTASGMLTVHHAWVGYTVAGVAFLLFAVRTSMREWQMHQYQSKLYYAANYDFLTGAANRSMLNRELGERLELIRKKVSRNLAVISIDIDGFKMINDSMGHSTGDAILRQIVHRLQNIVRTGDLIARHGGDEFLVVLDEIDQSAAVVIGEQILAHLRQPLVAGQVVYHVSASLGIAMSNDFAHCEALLQDADCALYYAKRMGKNRVQVFTPDMLVSLHARLALLEDLKKALADKEIKPAYQPIYDVRTGRLHGFEALARWYHPKRGLISPAEFIPVAEENSLIGELGSQMLFQACRQCRMWNHRFGTRLTISVNLSPFQLCDPGMLQGIIHVLESTAIDPGLLKLEITESALLTDFDGVASFLKEVKALGVQLALDDFGTGYSSLSTLLKYPFDVLKIDRSFVTGLNEDPRKAETVQAIIHLAAQLKMQVVAEGVETAAEVDHLSKLACDYLQGFYLARPLSPEKIEERLGGGMEADVRPTPVATKSLVVVRCPGSTSAADVLSDWSMNYVQSGRPSAAEWRPQSH